MSQGHLQRYVLAWRQHKGVVSLVRAEDRKDSATPLKSFNMRNRPSGARLITRYLVTRVKQQWLPDSYKSQMCDLEVAEREDGAITLKYFLGTREAHEGERGWSASELSICGERNRARTGERESHMRCGRGKPP